jgi:hypothetical protein
MTTASWLPTRDLVTTKNLEIRKRRGLMITMVILVVLPTVLFYGLRLIFHAVDPSTYGPAGSPGNFSQFTNLAAEFGFIAAAALGAAAGTTDLSDGMFRHLVITGRSRLALFLARIPAGLAIIVPLVAVTFLINCLVTTYQGSPNPTTVAVYGLSLPEHLDQAELKTWLLDHPQQDANGLPLLGNVSTTPQIRAAIDSQIDTLYAEYINNEYSGSNPADNEMIKIGLWLELDVGIAFLVGLGLGSLTGQRTTTVIVLIALEIIVTPLLGRVQLPYFIDGQRLLIGIAMDQLRPVGLGSGAGGAGGGSPGQQLFGGHAGLTLPPMPTWAMISVIVGWIVVWCGLGAWRMITRDALETEGGGHHVEAEAHHDQAQRGADHPVGAAHPVLGWQRLTFQEKQEAQHDRQQQGVHHLYVDGQTHQVEAGEHDGGADDVGERVGDVELGVLPAHPVVEAVPPAEYLADAPRARQRHHQRRDQRPAENRRAHENLGRRAAYE